MSALFLENKGDELTDILVAALEEALKSFSKPRPPKPFIEAAEGSLSLPMCADRSRRLRSPARSG
ncbi:hypothetical protein A4U53_016005 [Rhizobium ruizarguesonis]|uniref:Uncharacterized protein n=1 Tax=Rhizobium ruizarguesonis TaxID=2081791 RepID=A0ACD5EV80_9HYPH